jgi:site-specific DNA recombinase
MLPLRADKPKVLAAGYIRVSGERQVVEGNSLTTQEVQLKAYAMQCGYVLLKVFVEKGQSAKSDNRPVLKEMLAWCKARRSRLSVVIFPKLDRFARYSRDYQNLKHRLYELGIRLESASERFDDTPAGRFNESVLAAVAQLDNEVRAERALDGHITARKEGRWPWVAPGFEKVVINNRKTIRPKEPEASYMQEVFDRLGRRKHRIVDVQRFLASKGMEFSDSALSRWIRHKIYIGVVESHGVTQIGAAPIVPLVSEQLFNAAQATLRQHKKRGGYERDNPSFPLRGTLRCTCGQFLTASWSKGKTKRYPYYRCAYCPNVNLPKEFLERAFVGFLNQLQPPRDRLEELRAILLARWEVVAETLADARARVDRKVASLKQLQRNLVLKVANGVIPDDLGRDQISEIQSRISDWEGQRPLDSPAVLQPAIVIDFFLGFLSRPGDSWYQSHIEHQKHLQRFYWPSGLTYLGDGHFGTHEKDPFAGLQSGLLRQFSHFVGSPTETANSVAWKKRVAHSDESRILAELGLKIYEEFARPTSAETARERNGRR